ncbi:MAG: hypothetical protein RMK19_06960 [Bacteroidia bacterium]|nr:hypothetical protein [Bacteroidia bacterium]MDW8015736.1 hypothetical protein [Bacteroidia bacterium]
MRKYLLVYFVSFLAACGRRPDEPVIARYGDRYLSRNEALARITIPEGSDTTLLLRTYAAEWIRQQALADTAYRLLPELRTRVEAQVQDYRAKLLVAYLSRLLMEKAAAQWSFSDSVLLEKYHAQSAGFRALQPYYRYRWVRLAPTHQARQELSRALGWSDSAWARWLESKNYAGGVVGQWVPRSALDSLQFFFPTSLSTLPLRGTAQTIYTEGKTSTLLVFQLTGLILPGQVLPFEMVREQVRNLLLQEKLHAWLAGFEDSVYKRAIASGVGELY